MSSGIPRCDVCKGSGVFIRRPSSCYHFAGNCPCEMDAVECEVCSGTGSAVCEDCQLMPATEMMGSDPYCELCANEARGRSAA